MEDNFKLSDFSSFKGIDGKERKMDEYQKYLKETSTYKGQLKIGDVVKLKGIDIPVVITHINFETAVGIVDYAGKRIDRKDEDLLNIFNQKDIETKVEDKIKKETLENER